ncbi:MAG: type II secretion system F family protein [archaeon]|nr:type II secretion system F family protein [archaeon]
MFISDIIVKLSNGIENNLNETILISFQEYLLKAGIFTMASNIIATLIFTIFLFLILSIFLSFILSFDLVILMIFSVFGPIILLIGIVLIKSEKRLSQVETSIPDFLRQLSSMLKVGLSLESALDDLSKNGKGPLYDELKRVVIEIKFGKSFEESISDMCLRLNSKDLDRSFKIILNARKSGGGLAEVIADISDDLRAALVLKRERKSAVTMSIMFLILASLFAAPFALGMIGIYSSFMVDLGKSGMICEVAPLAAELYLIIHSICSGFLIALIMYGDWKKGFKFSIPITVIAFLIFYGVNTLGPNLLSL